VVELWVVEWWAGVLVVERRYQRLFDRAL